MHNLVYLNNFKLFNTSIQYRIDYSLNAAFIMWFDLTLMPDIKKLSSQTAHAL